MIVLPWYFRFAIDIVVISTPFVYLHYHPTTFAFEHFQEKRVIKRKLPFENSVFQLKPDAVVSKDQSAQLYRQLGLEM